MAQIPDRSPLVASMGAPKVMEENARFVCDRGGDNGRASRCFEFLSIVSKEFQLRDLRGLALLIALSDESCRSIPAQPGVSVQYLAGRLEEPEEVVRHLIRVAQIGGLVTRCGHVQRTFLYRITPEAKQKLERCLAIFGKIDAPAPAEHEENP